MKKFNKTFGQALNFNLSMKNILLLLFLTFISCNNKTEFIQSKAIGNLFLLRNPPKEDSLTKKLIRNFLLKNPPKYANQLNRIDFYIYTSNTKYFLDHEEDDPSGLSLGEEQLSFYDDDRIAVFSIGKCKKDTTKLVGELRFFNEYGNFYKPDTLIYKCN